MSEATQARRWFRFSLRTLFVAMTLACVLRWLGMNYRKVQSRKRLWRNGSVIWTSRIEPPDNSTLPLGLRLFGATQVCNLQIYPEASAVELEAYRKAFPEAVVELAPPRSEWKTIEEWGTIERLERQRGGNP